MQVGYKRYTLNTLTGKSCKFYLIKREDWVVKK